MDMFDPRRFSFDAILQYLDQLIQVAKGCTLKNNLNDGYIGFRRFQIVLNCLQQHNLYDPEDTRIQSLNTKSFQIQSIVNLIRQRIEEGVNASNANLLNKRGSFHSSTAPTHARTRSELPPVSRENSLDKRMDPLRGSTSSFSPCTYQTPPLQKTVSFPSAVNPVKQTTGRPASCSMSSLLSTSWSATSLQSSGSTSSLQSSCLGPSLQSSNSGPSHLPASSASSHPPASSASSHPPASSASSLQASTRLQLDYIKANLDTIPDVRGTPMHIGLPLPDDE
ncbi:hypothetical protein WA588_001560, partial [Blastocystis sp. NMH]